MILHIFDVFRGIGEIIFESGTAINDNALSMWASTTTFVLC
jgi:hypothetical protein